MANEAPKAGAGPAPRPSFCEGARVLPVQGVRAGTAFAVDDWVAEEVPVALEYNGISHAVMLATPLDLEEFALGFSLSEGILSAPHELFSVEEEASEQGITLHLRNDTPLDPAKIMKLVQPRHSSYRLSPDGKLSRRSKEGEAFGSGLEAADKLLSELASCMKDGA